MDTSQFVLSNVNNNKWVNTSCVLTLCGTWDLFCILLLCTVYCVPVYCDRFVNTDRSTLCSP